jgi:hypothetical protein
MQKWMKMGKTWSANQLLNTLCTLLAVSLSVQIIRVQIVRQITKFLIFLSYVSNHSEYLSFTVLILSHLQYCSFVLKDFYIVWIHFSDLFNNYQTSWHGNWNYLKTADICNEKFGFEIFLNKMQAIIWNIWQEKNKSCSSHAYGVDFYFVFPCYLNS